MFIQSKWTLTFSLFVATFLISIATLAIESDQIGPDPIQSENCVIVTPGRSLVCRGDYVPHDPEEYPTITINCQPGVFLLLTHKSILPRSWRRSVTIRSDADQKTLDWLSFSDTQSGSLVFYRGAASFDYEFILITLGRILDPAIASFDVTLDETSIRSYFEFDPSDQNLFKQIADSCGK